MSINEFHNLIDNKLLNIEPRLFDIEKQNQQNQIDFGLEIGDVCDNRLLNDRFIELTNEYNSMMKLRENITNMCSNDIVIKLDDLLRKK